MTIDGAASGGFVTPPEFTQANFEAWLSENPNGTLFGTQYYNGAPGAPPRPTVGTGHQNDAFEPLLTPRRVDFSDSENTQTQNGGDDSDVRNKPTEPFNITPNCNFGNPHGGNHFDRSGGDGGGFGGGFGIRV